MKKETRNNIELWTVSFVASLAIVGSLIAVSNTFNKAVDNKARNEKEPQTKEIVADAEAIYKHKFDSLKRHYDSEKIGLRNEFRDAVEDINKSRASTSAKNAAIAQKANQYIAAYDSVHLVFIDKVDEVWHQSR